MSKYALPRTSQRDICAGVLRFRSEGVRHCMFASSWPIPLLLRTPMVPSTMASSTNSSGLSAAPFCRDWQLRCHEDASSSAGSWFPYTSCYGMGIYVTGWASTLRDTPLRYGIHLYVTGQRCPSFSVAMNVIASYHMAVYVIVPGANSIARFHCWKISWARS